MKLSDLIVEEATTKLYKCRKSDGTVEMKELTSTMFSSMDAYRNAVDQSYEHGFCDTPEEAKEDFAKKRNR